MCVSIVKFIYLFTFIFPFSNEGGMLDLIVLVPEHCLTFYPILYPINNLFELYRKIIISLFFSLNLLTKL